jgi:hypothetical protein
MVVGQQHGWAQDCPNSEQTGPERAWPSLPNSHEPVLPPPTTWLAMDHCRIGQGLEMP